MSLTHTLNFHQCNIFVQLNIPFWKKNSKWGMQLYDKGSSLPNQWAQKNENNCIKSKCLIFKIELKSRRHPNYDDATPYMSQYMTTYTQTFSRTLAQEAGTTAVVAHWITLSSHNTLKITSFQYRTLHFGYSQLSLTKSTEQKGTKHNDWRLIRSPHMRWTPIAHGNRV